MNTMKARGLCADNDIIREANHENASDFKSIKCDRDENPLKTKKKYGDIDSVPQIHDSTNFEHRKDVRDNHLGASMTQNTVPVGDMNLIGKEAETYTEKSVTECKVPELVCLRETSSHVVKDIWIDEGTPSLDKTVVENREVNHNGCLSFSGSVSDVHSDLIKVMMEDLASMSDVVKPLVEQDSEMDVTSKCLSENLMENGEGDSKLSDGHVNVSSSEKFVTKDKLFVGGLEVENFQAEPSNFDVDEDVQQSEQDTSKESNSNLFCAAEELSCNNANEIPSNVFIERDSITTEPGPSAPLESDVGEEQQKLESQLVHTSKNSSVADGLGESRSSASSRIFFTELGHGESSFSAVDNPSALLTYSGPIVSSGNISLRSDSSTTSTRSFAFPILQTDWNTSPVRMAKADRRHYRKHQRWKLSLLCCRF